MAMLSNEEITQILHTSIGSIFIVPFFLFVDHPIHPPKTNADPWDCEFLPDQEDHVIKMVNGVFQVYRNQADVEANKPASDYEFPDLDTYVTDMQLMCALIGKS